MKKEVKVKCDCTKIDEFKILKLGINGEKIDITKVKCPKCRKKYESIDYADDTIQ